MATCLNLTPIRLANGWRLEHDGLQYDFTNIVTRSGGPPRGTLAIAAVNGGDPVRVLLDTVTPADAKQRAEVLKRLEAKDQRGDDRVLVALHDIAAAAAAAEPPPDRRRAAARPKLTGAQSIVDDVLIYVFRFDDEVFVVTSQRQLLEEPALSATYRVDPPELDTRCSRAALNRYLAGDPPPDGAELFAAIQQLLEDHVEWPSRDTAVLVALWVMATYLARVFTYVPYLAFSSITKRSGKSLALEIIAELAFNATDPVANPTPASIYRSLHADAATLLVDEVEGLGDRDSERRQELMAVLNVGFKCNAVIPRMEKVGDRYQRVAYRAFGFKAFAGIKEVAETIRDRSLAIRLVRKATSRKTARFNLRLLGPRLQQLRDALHVWALEHVGDVLAAYAAAETLPVPAVVDDRLRDITEPLFAVAAVVDRDAESTETSTALARAVAGQTGGREDDPAEAKVRLAVTALLACFADDEKKRVLPTEALVEILRAGGLAWVREDRHARALMRQLGFRSRTGRDRGGPSIRGYHVRRDILTDLRERYPEPSDGADDDA